MKTVRGPIVWMACLITTWMTFQSQPLDAALPAAPGTTGAPRPATNSFPAVHGDLQQQLNEAVRLTLAEFAGRQLQSTQIACTVIDLTDPAAPRRASYRGTEQIYPASVIKLFYLAAAHRWLEDGRLQETPELQRALKDMIVESYNEATGYVVDLLTGTTSGPELSPEEMAVWYEKRNAVNRHFSGLGYERVVANRKPWCEGPYGREMQSVRMHSPSRNWLTTDDTARLLMEIVTGQAVNPARSREMMALLARDPFGQASDPDDQAHGFTGPAVPPGGRLWSKAGWTSATRHDAAYVELPDGRKWILVTFTVDHANERGIIPALARHFLRAAR